MTFVAKKKASLPRGVYYLPSFISLKEREDILVWLRGLHPIWENRYSESNPPPPGDHQRQLLRPVYWLGNWQFACLDYYHPPHGVDYRCVRAEPFPDVLARIVGRIEERVRNWYSPVDVPKGWRLNTCLVNFYGHRVDSGGRREDLARVGEHRDYEPGPVASLSLGERALFQFVKSSRPGTRDGVVLQQWLAEGALQVFGGRQWKDVYFHRVQRVEAKLGDGGGLKIPEKDGFVTRRVNFTFRFVPEQHVVPYARLPAEKAKDIQGYMAELGQYSEFFREALACRQR
jgi:alkylated DNA repair dioxygenase AlkB